MGRSEGEYGPGRMGSIGRGVWAGEDGECGNLIKGSLNIDVYIKYITLIIKYNIYKQILTTTCIHKLKS